MVAQPPSPVAQLERIQVQLESHGPDKQVKIRLENYDESLGWYTSGSLSLGLHQLPLLEQAVEAMRSFTSCEETSEEKTIPFPGRTREIYGQAR